MFTFIARRLLLLPLLLLGVTLLVVLLMQLLSPTERAAGFVNSEAQMRNLPAIIEQYGLDKPWYVQYGSWLSQALQGNLGFSRVTNEPVLETIRKRLPNTLELAVLTIIPTIGLGIWLGTLAALNRDRFLDNFTRVTSIIFWSLPTFVLAIWLLIIFYGGFGLFGLGQLSANFAREVLRPEFERYTGFMTLDALLNGRFDVFWNAILHLILPVATLVLVISAQIVRVMRSSMLDTLSQDYVRTARAKGLGQKSVNNKHARRNALIPVLTLSGFTLVGLLNGSVIVETIFALPGVGKWLADAAVQLDYGAILGGAVFVGFLVVLGNLIVDILYAVVDPRIRY